MNHRNNSIENTVSSITATEEEKKRQKREEKKLAIQKRRANLSEEQKQQLKEQKRIKSQQKRANLSEEEREKINQKVRERRANLSDEKRALIKAKDAIKHRNKYQEDKAFLKRHHLDDKKHKGNRSINIGEDEDDEDDEDEDEDKDDESENEAADRVNKLLLNRQKRKEKNNDYKKARYEQLKNAQEKLKEISNDENINENDIQQLQLLASRRQQTLEYGRQYSQTYRQNQHRWIPIQQVWDEDNPCR
jgi:hypothetical protein